MVSVTMASVIEFAGKKREPNTERLVVEALVIKSLILALEVANKFVEVTLTAKILVGLKFDVEKLVTLRLLKKALVEVIAVPEAVVKVRAPLNVPPVSGK